MKTETILKQLAEQVYGAFERGERPKAGEREEPRHFYKLNKDAPQWMTDALYAAHDNGEFLPNDWIYDTAHTIASNMADADPDSWDDQVGEWADGCADVYNADRTAWLASHLRFASYVDEAVSDLGHSEQGVFGDIGMGQYQLASQIAHSLIQAVRDEAERVEDEADESDEA
jgi:hypothetical protein